MAGYSSGERLYGSGAQDREAEPPRIVEHRSHRRMLPRASTSAATTKETRDISQRLYGSSAFAQIEVFARPEVSAIRVLVAEDHPVVRDALIALLALQQDIEVVGTAANGQEAVEKVPLLSPDVVLMDMRMPVMGGLEATKRITEAGWAKVLMLSQYDEDDNVFASSQAGALGFVPKRNSSLHLLDGIRCVSEGKRYLPPNLLRASRPEKESAARQY